MSALPQTVSYNEYKGHDIQIWQSAPNRYTARISRQRRAVILDRNSMSEARRAAEWYADNQKV